MTLPRILVPLLVLTGAIACSNEGGKQFSYPVTVVDSSEYQEVDSLFSIESLERFVIDGPGADEQKMFVAEYQADGEERRAIVYPVPIQSEGKSDASDEKKEHRYRREKWQFLSAAVKEHSNDSDRFITYWDNAQRLRLFTGRAAVPELPAESAYPSAEEKSLWRRIAGGFGKEEQLVTFAQCLVRRSEDAKECLSPLFTNAGDNYILVSTDDMAHIQEISRLAGRSLPLETRLFSTDSDLHGRIRQVREWAREGEGTGSYMLQPVDANYVRAWRIIDPAFEESLLAGLLPFTSSADKDFADLKLVFQSDWGGYLSLYQITH